MYPILALFFSFTVSYFSCFIFGFPLVSFLKRRNKLNTTNLLVAGSLFGAIIFSLFGFGLSFVLGAPFEYHTILEELLWGAIFGGVVSILFGLIAGFPWFGSAC